MKAKEFINEKRKRKKPRWAAYGPGPYGGYGYAVGYSGDGGASGGDGGGGVGEASYPGNLGMMELAKFFQVADDAKKKLFQELLQKGKKGLAWKLVQDTVDVKLQGKEFEDQHPNDSPLGPEFKPTMPKGTLKVDISDIYDWYKLGVHIANLKGLGKHDFGQGAPSTIISFGDEDSEHEYIKALLKTGLKTTDIDPKSHETKRGQKTDPTYNVENHIISELKITEKDIQRIIKDRLAIDAENGVEAMKSAIDKMISMPSSSYVKSQAAQLMMLYKQAKMSIGGEYYKKLNKLSENFADGKVKGKSKPGRVKRSGASCNGSVTDLRKRAKNSSGEKAKMYHWCANMKSGRNK